MDPRSFDRLARALGSAPSRRRILKTLAGGALGAMATVISRQATDAVKLRSVGNSCKVNGDCASGLCVTEGRTRKICHCGSIDDCPAGDQCRTASCNGGACRLDVNVGAACDDGQPCTTGDVCQANGRCAGTPVVCPAPTACQVSVSCDAGSGQCAAVNQPDGTLCGADHLCTHDLCQSGTCATNVPKAQGTACNDQNACTQTDACDGQGACIGGDPVTCPPADLCHDNGVCNTGTGICGANPITTGTCFIAGVCYASGDLNPSNACQSCAPATSQTAFTNRANGTVCDDGNLCTQTDTCQGGVCTGSNPKTCTALDQCHDAGTCNASTGACSNPQKVNGTTCTDGNPTCHSGACCGGEGYEAVHGGCFRLRDSGCSVGCGSAGSVEGSNNYLCISQNAGGSCKSNSDCPLGQACTSSTFCVIPC